LLVIFRSVKSHVNNKTVSLYRVGEFYPPRLPAEGRWFIGSSSSAWRTAIGGGIGIHWAAIDEDILVASLLQPENYMRLPNKALQRTAQRRRR